MTYRYDFVPTPFGDALVVFSGIGIVRFDLSEAEDPGAPWLLERISRALGEEPESDAGAADELAHLVAAYFDGEVIDFSAHMRFDWRLAPGFSGEALRTIGDIPYGQTLSYGEVAALAGHPRAARAVGTACRLSPFSVIVPVHRVIRSDGTVGKYGAHAERKRFLLDLEKESSPQRAASPVKGNRSST